MECAQVTTDEVGDAFLRYGVYFLQYQTERDGVMVEKRLLINTEGNEDPAQVHIYPFSPKWAALSKLLSIHLFVYRILLD